MITFIVPTYNEFSNIELFVKKINQLKLNIKYKILFVDDDSDDGSLKIFKKVKNKYPNVYFIIRKSSKKDLTKSILYSLEFIDTKYILVIDCDLQHDVNAIPVMIENILLDKYDIIIGSREIDKIKSFKRRYISFIGIWITKLIGIPKLIDPLSGFFLIKSEDFKKINTKIKTSGYKVLLSVIFNLRKNIKIKEITIKFFPRKFEKSKLNYKVIFQFIIQIIYLTLLRIFNK